MSKPLPSVLVYQEFNTQPSEMTDPLRPFIMGPEYDLHRYTDSSEKAQATDSGGDPATYDPDYDAAFPWARLGLRSGGVVDQTYSKVFLENALLQYYSGATVGAAVAGYKNRVRISSLNIVGNGDSYPLAGAFYDRDVRVGDSVKIDAIVTAVPYEVNASITGFVAEATSAVTGAASADAANKGNASAATGTWTYVPVSGSTTNITGATSGTYDGIPSGYVTETYTVRVTVAGATPDVSTWDITSASGTDDVIGFVPPVGFGSAIDIGTRGLKVTLTANASTLHVNDTWTVTAVSDYAAVVPTSSGTYTGAKDTTYILSCVTGGDMAGSDSAAIKVTTNNGYDTGSTFSVTDDSPTTFDVGTYGVKVAFNASTIDRIAKGEKFYIVCTAAGTGAIKTFTIDKSLPTAMISGTPALNVTLYIKKDSVELTKETELNDPYAINWEQDETELTLQAGAVLYDSTWRDGLYGLYVKSGDLFIHWRELITDHGDKVYSIDNTDDLSSLCDTPIDPDNPFVYGVNKALLNSNGTSVRAMAVLTDDLEGYSYVLDKITTREDVYTIVPLTHDLEVLQQVSGHVNSLSEAEAGQWRMAMVCTEVSNPSKIVQYLDDGVSEVTATTTLNGTRYDVELTNAAIAGGATFADVTSGDTLRINYDNDAYGNPVYQSITVTSKESDTLIKITDVPDPLVGTAMKIEIWRTLDAQGLADEISLSPGTFSTRRVYDVYPDLIESGGQTVAGYYLAAALAGLRGGVLPHQSLTNVTITGFDNADQVVKKFNQSQLKQMLDAGRWIVTHDLADGSVYTLKQVSTDNTDLNTTEQSVTSNVDSMSYLFRRDLSPFIGRSNVTDSLIELLYTQIRGTINYLKSSGFTETLGGQLRDATIKEIRQHTTLKDRVVCTLLLTIPYPLNVIELHLVI